MRVIDAAWNFHVSASNVTADVTYVPSNPTGCTDFAPNSLTGKIVWMEYHRCRYIQQVSALGVGAVALLALTSPGRSRGVLGLYEIRAQGGNTEETPVMMIQ